MVLRKKNKILVGLLPRNQVLKMICKLNTSGAICYILDSHFKRFWFVTQWCLIFMYCVDVFDYFICHNKGFISLMSF